VTATESNRSSFARAALLGFFVVTASCGVLAAREVSVGRDEVARSDDAAMAADWPGAIEHAFGAAEAWVPGSPWPSRGRQRLAAIGHDAEGRRDDETALLAYGALRRAVLATRTVGWNNSPWRTAAEEGLSRIAAGAPDVPARREARAIMLAALEGEETRPTGTLALLMASALAITTGLGRLAWTDGPGDAGVRLGRALVACGFVAFAVALLMN
jgi:hypothetical protein